MIGAYGGVVFSTSDHRIQNFLNLKRESTGRYQNHETINTKPKSEFLGSGLDSLSFSMELSAFHGVSPMSVINRLRGYVQNGVTAKFILGGRNLGRYKITTLSESYDVITHGGGVMTAKVDVTLEEYR